MAVRNDSIWTPLTILDARINMTAFITNEKSPSVSKLIGSVKRRRIGLTITFSMPKMTTSTKAVVYPSRWKPGTILAATKIISARMSHPTIIFIRVPLK